MRIPLVIRFCQYFRAGSPDGCWNWTGTKNRAGYGMIGIGGRSEGHMIAHRYMYELVYGTKLPKGQSVVIMHTCDNPACVNPRHLRRGTMRDNILDMHQKGRAKWNPNPPPPKSRPGSANGNSKLTETDVARIRQRIRDGERIEHLAREYNVRPTTLGWMRDRVTWKHVP